MKNILREIKCPMNGKCMFSWSNKSIQIVHIPVRGTLKRLTKKKNEKMKKEKEFLVFFPFLVRLSFVFPQEMVFTIVSVELIIKGKFQMSSNKLKFNLNANN